MVLASGLEKRGKMFRDSSKQSLYLKRSWIGARVVLTAFDELERLLRTYNESVCGSFANLVIRGEQSGICPSYGSAHNSHHTGIRASNLVFVLFTSYIVQAGSDGGTL